MTTRKKSNASSVHPRKPARTAARWSPAVGAALPAPGTPAPQAAAYHLQPLHDPARFATPVVVRDAEPSGQNPLAGEIAEQVLRVVAGHDGEAPDVPVEHLHGRLLEQLVRIGDDDGARSRVE